MAYGNSVRRPAAMQPQVKVVLGAHNVSVAPPDVLGELAVVVLERLAVDELRLADDAVQLRVLLDASQRRDGFQTGGAHLSHAFNRPRLA